MTLDDIHAIVEEKFHACESELEQAYDEGEIKKIEGCMEAFQLVMKLIEDSHEDPEL